jgi:glycosyltransferase involved in cell wall biosynthesis
MIVWRPTAARSTMKISILLPTRNRLELLRHAVASVRRQEDENWEVVISDNDSEEDIAGYVESLQDERVRYLRTPRALPVTENWNNALAAATGEYVIMLGDDDALLGNYFATIRQLVGSFSEPDVIYHSALLYAYPSVLPDAPEGYLKPYGYAPFFRDAHAPYVLDRTRARRLVDQAMDFRVVYGFNMQFVTVSRRMIEELQDGGRFYRSPFPDYYAMNLLFLRAPRIVVEPRPCVVIGVSPKSYGFFHANHREQTGKAMLEGTRQSAQKAPLETALLPGSNINDGWLQAMEALSDATRGAFDVHPNLRRYRMLQLAHVHQGYFLDQEISREQLEQLRTYMRPSERILYGGAGWLARAVASSSDFLDRAVRDVLRRGLRQLPSWNPPNDPRHFESILEVCERFDPDSDPRRTTRTRQGQLRIPRGQTRTPRG